MLLPPSTDALFKLVDELYRHKSELPRAVVFELRSLRGTETLLEELERYRAALPRKVVDALDRFNRLDKDTEAQT